MRRSIIAVATVAGLVVILTSVAVARPSNRNDDALAAQYERISQLTFCEKSYEIASSFPSYASRNAVDPDMRERLVQQADFLSERQRRLAEYLDTRVREETIRVGVSPAMYDSVLAEHRLQAELNAIQSFQAVEDPNVVLRRLNGLCARLITQ